MAEKKPIDWIAVIGGIIGGIIAVYILGTLVGMFVPEAAAVAAKIPAMIFLILIGICVFIPFYLIMRLRQQKAGTGVALDAGELLVLALIIAVVVFAFIYIPRLLPDIFKETAFNFKLAVFGG